MSPKPVVCALGLATLALGVASHRAEACGAFFSTLTHQLSLASEQALIVYDAEHRREHFIREVTFRGDETPFGFVVPTPSRPEVAKAESMSFDRLERAFPFEPNHEDEEGAPAAAEAPTKHGKGRGVTVLELKKVGSFTAFVLAATDKHAFKKWLDENRLSSTPETEAWLEHYVERHFFYVAMRYDPKHVEAKKDLESNGEQPPKLSAETVRISFSSPLPYYPYLEPLHRVAEKQAPRIVSLRLAANEAFVPVTLERRGAERHWVTPFREGARSESAEEALRDALGDDLARLVSSATKVVQTFEDQKTARAGFGDVVFAPEKSAPLDDKRKAELEPMLSLLDDTLERPR